MPTLPFRPRPDDNFETWTVPSPAISRKGELTCFNKQVDLCRRHVTFSPPRSPRWVAATTPEGSWYSPTQRYSVSHQTRNQARESVSCQGKPLDHMRSRSPA